MPRRLGSATLEHSKPAAQNSAHKALTWVMAGGTPVQWPPPPRQVFLYCRRLQALAAWRYLLLCSHLLPNAIQCHSRTSRNSSPP